MFVCVCVFYFPGQSETKPKRSDKNFQKAEREPCFRALGVTAGAAAMQG